MKSINHAITGLASSLLLNVGLTSAAEKFDPVAQGKSAVVTAPNAASAQFSDYPCQFTAESGQ